MPSTSLFLASYGPLPDGCDLPQPVRLSTCPDHAASTLLEQPARTLAGFAERYRSASWHLDPVWTPATSIEVYELTTATLDPSHLSLDALRNDVDAPGDALTLIYRSVIPTSELEHLLSLQLTEDTSNLSADQ